MTIVRSTVACLLSDRQVRIGRLNQCAKVLTGVHAQFEEFVHESALKQSCRAEDILGGLQQFGAAHEEVGAPGHYVLPLPEFLGIKERILLTADWS